jgi:hypothetical protein
MMAMEAVSSSETLVNIYQTSRHNITEDSHLHLPDAFPIQNGLTRERFGMSGRNLT